MTKSISKKIKRKCERHDILKELVDVKEASLRLHIKEMDELRAENKVLKQQNKSLINERTVLKSIVMNFRNTVNSLPDGAYLQQKAINMSLDKFEIWWKALLNTCK